MSGVLGRTATHALNNATWPYVHLLASHGTETAIAGCHPLARGVATHDGKIVSPVLQKPPEQRETDVMEAVH